MAHVLRKYYRLVIAVLAVVVFLTSIASKNEVLQTILQKFQAHQQTHSQEKLYLHLDKPFYAAGDSIWFKAYLVEGSLHSLDSQSWVVYAELVDSAHRVIQRRMLPAVNGLAYGDFSLSTELHQGKYLIRAYTNYMKNVGEDFFFLKEFNVVNPAKNFTQLESERIFNADSIDLQFFAEGGNLVACGRSNRLVFKAMSPDGNSIAVSGVIANDRDSVIVEFKTEHDGMGMVTFIPQAGRTYYAQINNLYGAKKLYALPEVQQQGVSLQVNKTEKYIKVLANSSSTFANQEVHLVVQSRGKVYHAQSGIIKAQAWFAYIPRNKLPHGISHITLFDSFGRPLAERLVFQNHNEVLNLSIKTDTTSYKPRQQVITYLDAMYQNGTSAKGNFSISVYDDKLLQSPEKYPLDINSYLSLTSDLKGRIENPGYYFKDTLAITEKHLDLLMMVNGWRRFTWQDVLDKNQLAPLFIHEKGIPISGYMVKQWKDKPVPGSVLKLLTLNGQGIELNPDSLGNFYTDKLIFYDTVDLVARMENAKGKPQPYKFRIHRINIPPVLYAISAYTPFDASQYVKQQTEQQSLLRAGDITQLQEVTITALRPNQKKFNPWGKMVDVRKTRFNYYTIYELLQDNIPGLTIKGEHPDVKGRLNGKVPIIIINGDKDRGASFETIYSFKAGDVEMIELTKYFVEPIKYPQDLINIIVTPGAFNETHMGTHQSKYIGYYKTREFYSPRYDVPSKSELPDKRTTLHWEPMLSTDENGRVAVSFYTGDVRSRYRIVVEGITPDGYSGTASYLFDVK